MIQNWMKEIAENCCLAACYYYISRDGEINKSDFLRWLSIAMENGDIDYNECFVNNPNNLVNGLVYKAETNTTGKKQIARFYNPRTGFSHFVIAKPDGRVVYDPLENSVTVKEGFIQDWRICN